MSIPEAVRIPPNNLDAETSVLGSILLDNDSYNQLEGQVRPEMFYKEANRKIFAAMEDLISRGAPVDTVTIVEELRTRNQIDEVGGVAYIVGLSDAVPTSVYASFYGQIVQEKASLRNLISASSKIMQLAFDEAAPVDELMERAEKLISNAKANTSHGPSTGLTFFTGDCAPEPQPVPWIIPGLIARGVPLIVFGQPGSKKTMHTAHLTACLCLGRDFLEFGKPSACRVLYLDFDVGWTWSADVFRAAFRGLGIEGLPESFAYYSPLDGDGSEAIALEKIGARILKAVRAHRADVVIVDSLQQAMTGDQNSNQDVSLALRQGLNAARASGAAVIVLDHASKAARNSSSVPTPSGGQQKRAWARVTVALEAVNPDDPNDPDTRISLDKTNAAPWKPLVSRLLTTSREGRLQTLIVDRLGDAGPRTTSTPPKAEDVAREAILAALETRTPVRRAEFPEGGTYDRAFASLCHEQIIERLERGVFRRPLIEPEIEPKTEPNYETPPAPTPNGAGALVLHPVLISDEAPTKHQRSTKPPKERDTRQKHRAEPKPEAPNEAPAKIHLEIVQKIVSHLERFTVRPTLIRAFTAVIAQTKNIPESWDDFTETQLLEATTWLDLRSDDQIQMIFQAWLSARTVNA